MHIGFVGYDVVVEINQTWAYFHDDLTYQQQLQATWSLSTGVVPIPFDEQPTSNKTTEITKQTIITSGATRGRWLMGNGEPTADIEAMIEDDDDSFLKEPMRCMKRSGQG